MDMNDRRQANRRTLIKLSLVAVAMFGFGYALVPLYDLLCDVTGLNGKTGRTDTAQVQAQQPDMSRTVIVEFTGHVSTGLPWEFRPLQKSMKVVPGKVMVAKYIARNSSGEAITGQAIPSVAPGKAASHFKKIECFCFSQQTLQPGEEKEMPVQFIVDTRLAPEVDRITLSYAFFNTDKVSAKRYGGTAVAGDDTGSHDHHRHSAPPGGGA